MSFLTKIQGVYFLFKSDKIIYIGCSNDIVKRLRNHEHIFDSFAIIECKNPFILESLYIGLLRPKLNINNKSKLQPQFNEHYNLIAYRLKERNIPESRLNEFGLHYKLWLNNDVQPRIGIVKKIMKLLDIQDINELMVKRI